MQIDFDGLLEAWEGNPMTRGSTWNIWDFHLHTPYSVLNNQFGDPEEEATWERYLTAIETKVEEVGVKAIAVTDYFTIEGYKRLRHYQQHGRLENILLFPNVEFRVDTIIEGRRLNYHVLFSPNVSMNDIEEHFLHDLNFVHQEEPFDGGDLRKLKRSNLEEFGQTLREQHEPFRQKSSLEIGCMNAKVKLDEIKQRLMEDSRFFGNYLLVLADDLDIDWDGQDHATRKQLIQMSHAIFSSNRGSRDFYLGKRHSSEEEFITEFKSLKPCIWGCDSHGLEERFLEPDEGRFCWIKGEVSWEGLRQVLFEPEARVRIQSDSPEPQKSVFTLDAVQVEGTQVNNALHINDLQLKLNPNLVAIIGGRGSGKTALLDLIATCFPEGKKLSRLKNSFYHRLYSRDGRKVEDAKPVPISISFRSRDRFRKKVGEEEAVFEQADLLYLTQNHMDEYTARPERLYKHVIELVFEQKPDEQHGYDKFDEEAEELQREIESLNLKIEQIEFQVDSNLSNEKRERKQKAGELADYQTRLHEQSEQQADSGKETEKLTDRLKSLKAQRDGMIALRDRSVRLLDKIDQFHAHYRTEAKTLNAQLVSFTELATLQSIPSEISQINAASQTLSRNISRLHKVVPDTESRIDKVEEELDELEGIDRTLAQLRRTINATAAEIEKIDERIKALEEKEKLASSLDIKRVEKYAVLMQKMVEQRLYLQQRIDQFETDQDDLLSGLSFAAIVDTSLHCEYVQRLAEKADGRAHSFNSIDAELGEIIEAASQELNTQPHVAGDADEEESRFLPFVKKLREWAVDIRLKTATTEAEFFNALFSPFFDIGLYIEFNGRPLEALSMGERAIVLLKILLGLDDKPLLIDQPEEHLDNRYIYQELMPAFRTAKTRRQIIIATHNANLVVNTDAEQIIIAEHESGKLSYKIGALEDLNIRDGIKTILEGGDQAFKEREKKYGYRF